jgi:hypothetical protein
MPNLYITFVVRGLVRIPSASNNDGIRVIERETILRTDNYDYQTGASRSEILEKVFESFEFHIIDLIRPDTMPPNWSTASTPSEKEHLLVDAGVFAEDILIETDADIFAEDILIETDADIDAYAIVTIDNTVLEDPIDLTRREPEVHINNTPIVNHSNNISTSSEESQAEAPPNPYLPNNKNNSNYLMSRKGIANNNYGILPAQSKRGFRNTRGGKRNKRRLTKKGRKSLKNRRR